jgi:hypothetical protein
MWHVWERGKAPTRFCWKNLREGDHVETLGMDTRIMLQGIFKNWLGVWIGMNWLSAGTGGGLF